MSTTTTATSVLIVGAGPVGSVLALTLLKNGIPVRLIDKTGPQVGQKGLGIQVCATTAQHASFSHTDQGIQPRSLEMHHFLGTLPDILSVAKRAPLCTIYKTPGGTEVLKTFEFEPHEEPTPDLPYLDVLMLGQHRQQSIIHRHLQQHGCKIEFNTELLSFEQLDGYVSATIASKDLNGKDIVETVKVPYLVGTDGAHSVVRKSLGLTFLGDTRNDVHMVIGDIEVKGGLDRKLWHGWGDASTKFLTLLPTEVDDGIFTFIVSGKELDHAKTASGRDESVKAISFISDRNDIEFGDLIWMSQYRPNIRMVDKFGEGRVFVAGDAAHVHSPMGGQGTNSGVQDSFNLGWKLALVLKGLASPSLLDSYTEERLPVIATMLQKTTLLLNRGVGNHTGDGSKWERGREIKQLGVNYRGSSILVDETTTLDKDSIRTDSYSLAGDGVIHAGDRAPEAPGLVGSQGVTSLFDIFGPNHHTVLIFGPPEFDGGEIAALIGVYPKDIFKTVLILDAGSTDPMPHTSGVDLVLRDRDGHAHRAYPALPGSGTILVVRPDGVIGAIVTGVEGLCRYFKGVFLVK
ncbi:FAD binding domain-containing protein [Lentinula raphanica]|nr:FAD binding domain-containing protein [Lentinula raphanica]